MVSALVPRLNVIEAVQMVVIEEIFAAFFEENAQQEPDAGRYCFAYVPGKICGQAARKHAGLPEGTYRIAGADD